MDVSGFMETEHYGAAILRQAIFRAPISLFGFG